MAIALGKRKRAPPKPESSPLSSSSASEAEDLQDIFRRHFEAKFKPLTITKKEPQKTRIQDVKADDKPDSTNGIDEDDETASWDGLASDSTSNSVAAEDADTNTVEIIEHSTSHPHDRASKAELRAFMSSKPPSESKRTQATHASRPGTEDSDDEKANLKHDASLQKLLRESHILSSSKVANAYAPSYGSVHSTGRARHSAIDLHLQSMGAKQSTGLKHQQKMPMAMRQGITKARADSEAKRREEAKNLGVVLEKQVKGRSKEASARRERGVGGPSVGKFRGGTLQLSSKDIRDIRGNGGNGRGRRGRR